MAEPTVDIRPADADTTAVVLVLPGGKVDSFAPTSAGQLAVRRMRPIARAIHRDGRRHGVAVWTVNYRYRGWNGSDASPVHDVQTVLAEVRRRHGDVPVVLTGHSMGGRAALRAGGEAAVVGVAALAPWITDDDPIAQLAGRQVFIAHGNLDVVTSPHMSSSFARRAADVATSVTFVQVSGDMHAMVRWRTWHRLTTEFVLRLLDVPAL